MKAVCFTAALAIAVVGAGTAEAAIYNLGDITNVGSEGIAPGTKIPKNGTLTDVFQFTVDADGSFQFGVQSTLVSTSSKKVVSAGSIELFANGVPVTPDPAGAPNPQTCASAAACFEPTFYNGAQEILSLGGGTGWFLTPLPSGEIYTVVVSFTTNSNATKAYAYTASLTYTTVPEPSTWAMMGLGFAGLAFAGYRKAKGAAAIA